MGKITKNYQHDEAKKNTNTMDKISIRGSFRHQLRLCGQILLSIHKFHKQ
ncbi:uncharacterized protein G2W53_001362 [Senna tora]|uniref:Uncharacterized protein n=1 Tax=Senna tora TaxID=362788 RepID=A0A835CMH9_9FABA|nr:uncharacterized protein G2W53_001362 [Senna tora]